MITNNMKRDDPAAIKVYHIQSGNLLRTFALYPKGYIKEDEPIPPPPPFQWSQDDQYLARMGRDCISIFETPSMGLLENKSMLADGILEFQWSPRENILACWVS